MEQLNDTPPAPLTQVAEYSATAAALGDLRQKYERVIFLVATPAGMKDAIAARAELRDLRVGLEKMRKEIKAPALLRCQLIDSEAKTITAQLTALEDPIDAQIQKENARKAAEKAERERVEVERKAAIRAKIDGIRGLPAASFRDSAAEIEATLADLQNFDVAEAEFAEFVGEAQQVIIDARHQLADLLAKAQAAEAEAARLAAERAELERQKAEAAERERIAAAERAEIERQAAAARKAEEDRLRAEREAFEAERRAFAEQQAAAARAEQAKLAAADTLLVIDGTPNEAKALAASSNGLVSVPDFTPATAPAAEPATVSSFVGIVMGAGDDQSRAFTLNEGVLVEIDNDAAIVTQFRAATRALLASYTFEQARIIFDEELQRALRGDAEAA